MALDELYITSEQDTYLQISKHSNMENEKNKETTRSWQ